MNDLIDKEKAIEDLQNRDPSKLYDIEDIEYWINSLPSAEPTIIRCRDCKHHDGIRCFRWNSTIITITGFDDFCSNAEKRGEEE